MVEAHDANVEVTIRGYLMFADSIPVRSDLCG
jgi:hypothetical protein